MQVSFASTKTPIFQVQFANWGGRVNLNSSTPEEALRLATTLDSSETRRVVQFDGANIVTSWTLTALMVTFSTGGKNYAAQWRNADSGVTVGIVA